MRCVLIKDILLLRILLTASQKFNKINFHLFGFFRHKANVSREPYAAMHRLAFGRLIRGYIAV